MSLTLPDMKCTYGTLDVREEAMSKLTQFKMNLPQELKRWVEGEAAKNMRSISKEIIFILSERMEAATGAKFGDEAPAAALNTAALQSGDIINQALEMPDDHQGI